MLFGNPFTVHTLRDERLHKTHLPTSIFFFMSCSNRAFYPLNLNDTMPDGNCLIITSRASYIYCNQSPPGSLQVSGVICPPAQPLITGHQAVRGQISINPHHNYHHFSSTHMFRLTTFSFHYQRTATYSTTVHKHMSKYNKCIFSFLFFFQFFNCHNSCTRFWYITYYFYTNKFPFKNTMGYC